MIDANNDTNDEKCDCCSWHGLEKGTMLYILSDWHGGVAFEYIKNICYCPVCGKELPDYE